MRFHYSKHLHEELDRRKIPQKLLEQVLHRPEQKVPEFDNVTCYQSQVDIEGKPYLLRVMVNETVDPPVVVTVYRTSKISKYWRRP
ncbi:MAG: DUF4258 domain-containing protein [Candidatus Methylomirabilis oxyfera]|nr:DUF4258 domain-containing protein [Candidatus Methylomirabilis oxyfera]